MAVGVSVGTGVFVGTLSGIVRDKLWEKVSGDTAEGGAVMLYHLAALWCGFVVFSLVFFSDDPAALRRRGALTDSAVRAEDYQAQ